MTLRILIADDSATNRLLFSTVMTRLGHHADTAATGREALALFRDNRYDLVFLDLNMPVMDGFDTGAQIRQKNLRNIPVYAISGLAEDVSQISLDATGIRRCIQKPLDREKLDSVLAECGLATEATPQTTPYSIPQKLLSTYAQELRSRSRASACLRFADDQNIPALAREAHTVRALGQMLKTTEIETTAALLETACRLQKFDQEVGALHDACVRAAAIIERSNVNSSSTP